MCGFVGLWDLKNKYRSHEIISIVKKMRDSLASRGPDDEGIWLDKSSNFCFGHRRLSILEVSRLGHQPMISKNKRYVIAYNGEIYNYQEIRNELSQIGFSFRGNSDTEVLLEAISYWGLDETLKKICGMFAFGVWDKRKKKLFLIRDRVGIKPIYWSFQNNVIYFGSQPKCFLTHKHWKKEININSLLNYFQFGYVPNPESIYKDTKQLQPGCYLELDSKGNSKIKKYWDLKKIVKNNNLNHPSKINFKEDLKDVLEKVVSQHMISDVPLGCFLSGGIDSSTISLIMQGLIKKKNVKTYSIGFSDKTLFDETKYANSISKILGTEHINLFLDSKAILNNIPKILNEYDEPFADSSQLPTYLLSKLMRKNVTVCLSGDGGDELFGGYNRYLFAKKIKTIYSFCPFYLRNFLSNLILKTASPKIDPFFSLFGDKFHKGFNTDKLQKFAEILKIKNFKNVYDHLISFYPENEIPVNQDILKKRKKHFTFNIDKPNYVEQMQYFDTNFYLPNDILTKVDRASMAHGLEVRVPFLDHRIIEFAFKLPQEMKINNNKTKVILRNILLDKIPQKLLDRPKMGFAVPLVDWLRGSLKNWAYDLIYSSDADDGIINIKSVKKTFDEHIQNKRNWQNKIWTILVYINWKQKYYLN